MISRIYGTTMIQINAMTQLSKYEKNYRKQEEKQENSLHNQAFGSPGEYSTKFYSGGLRP